MTADLRIGAVILGAGFSRRFGADKRLQVLGERTVAETTVALYAESLGLVRVVLRVDDEALRNLLEPLPVEIVATDQAHFGMGHSLAAGFENLDWDYAFVALMDMPFIAPATLRRLSRSARRYPDEIVQPVIDHASQRERGHPVGMPRDLFSLLATAHGDQGARWILQQQAARVRHVPCNDSGIVRDIDRPSDLG